MSAGQRAVSDRT